MTDKKIFFENGRVNRDQGRMEIEKFVCEGGEFGDGYQDVITVTFEIAGLLDKAQQQSPL